MNEKANEVVGLIRENIARLGREGPTAQEVADAKAYITGTFPMAFDSNSKIAENLLGFRHCVAVTLEDLKRVAATCMKPENFTFVMVGKPTD